jgi:hypothetical protein
MGLWAQTRSPLSFVVPKLRDGPAEAFGANKQISTKKEKRS